MKSIYSAIFIIALSVFSAFPTLAQENEPVVIDEVVAQINDGVLTLSRIKREMKDYADALVEQKKISPEAAKVEIEGKQGELIANLIIEELLLQKGKEEGVEGDVEAQINQRFLQIMKEQGLKTLEALFTAMRSQGVNPDDLREQWRKQITRDMVMYREVDQKVYWGWSAKELRDYFDKNKAKFSKPETVTLSEIFLNFAGRDETTVREKAKQLVAQLRKGENFEKLAIENSDRPEVKENKGKVGTFKTSELNTTLGPPIKATKAGAVTDPIEIEGGIEIIRVDERVEASNESFFDEEEVRKALTVEKLPDARKKFLTELRKDAFIKIAETYRASVMAFLEKNDVTAEVKKPN